MIVWSVCFVSRAVLFSSSSPLALSCVSLAHANSLTPLRSRWAALGQSKGKVQEIKLCKRFNMWENTFLSIEMKQWWCVTFSSANNCAPGIPKGTCHHAVACGVFLLFCNTLLISASISQACQWERKEDQFSAPWHELTLLLLFMYGGKKIPYFLHVLTKAELHHASCKKHISSLL